MDLSSLKPAEGSVKNKKRIGRGQGTGRGGTSTRGHKGAKSRSGYSKKVGFEGGQMPLQRRVPKFGFKNPNRVDYAVVNLGLLQLLSEKGINDITNEVLVSNGLVPKNKPVKVLASGEISVSVNVTVEAFSKAAQEAIEKQGGTVNITK